MNRTNESHKKLDISFQSFQQKIANRLAFKLYLLAKLPIGAIVGLKMISLEKEQAVVGVGLHWLTKNPFQSIYFAVLAMAAELSTAAIALAYFHTNSRSMSILILSCNGNFHKKATGKIHFTCTDGVNIRNAISQAMNNDTAVKIMTTSIGKNENGEVVASFSFEWSYKKRK